MRSLVATMTTGNESDHEQDRKILPCDRVRRTPSLEKGVGFLRTSFCGLAFMESGINHPRTAGGCRMSRSAGLMDLTRNFNWKKRSLESDFILNRFALKTFCFEGASFEPTKVAVLGLVSLESPTALSTWVGCRFTKRRCHECITHIANESVGRRISEHLAADDLSC